MAFVLHGARRAQCLRSLAFSTSATLRQAPDPIQQQFVEKIRRYWERAGAAGDGQLVDASPRIKEELAEELNRLNRVFALTEDKLQFPAFTFAERKFEVVSLTDQLKQKEEEFDQIDRMTELERTGELDSATWMKMDMETEGYALEMFADDGVNYKEPTVKEILSNDYLLCDAEQEELYDDDKIVFFKHLIDPDTIPEVEKITSKEAQRFNLRF